MTGKTKASKDAAKASIQLKKVPTPIPRSCR
jgi:hypothetical protein